VVNLGTLGGYESVATGVNDRDQVVGFATNTISDPFSGLGTQIRAFRWQDGVMRDLGTLGTGTDSSAQTINERGQIAGSSTTNTIINPLTGTPTIDPFLWERGKMIDLGGLGGTTSDVAEGPFENSQGQVVGQSDIAGDVHAHPFLWTKPGPMQDLGTLGGDDGQALWINDVGEVVGWATNTGNQAMLAFFWKNGKMSSLGTVDGDPCSIAWGLNGKHQAVGVSWDCDNYLHAFLWEEGSMVDLNTLVPAGSGVQLTVAGHINERGEITAEGTFPSGDNHGFLLIPCDENHPGVEGCDYSQIEAGSLASSAAAPHEASTPPRPAALWRRNDRFHLPAFDSKN
jgi:probable HAF family extracellular repeat protein